MHTTALLLLQAESGTPSVHLVDLHVLHTSNCFESHGGHPCTMWYD